MLASGDSEQRKTPSPAPLFGTGEGVFVSTSAAGLRGSLCCCAAASPAPYVSLDMTIITPGFWAIAWKAITAGKPIGRSRSVTTHTACEHGAFLSCRDGQIRRALATGQQEVRYGG